mmetsp:Transcript_151117/g.367085  ORF Transcript_151117/g.367085 Transcript_151117/m.367085 type:complete len:225 (+) Transcript_151117:413-1087(+)
MMVLWSACSDGHSCVCPPKKCTMTAWSTTPVRTASPSTQTTLAAGTTRRARPCTASDTGSRRALSVKLALCSGFGRRPTVHRTTHVLTAATRNCWGPLAGTLISVAGPARTANAQCLTHQSLEPQEHPTPVPARGSRSSGTARISGCLRQVAQHRRSHLCQRPRRLQLRQRQCQPRRNPSHHPCRCPTQSQSPSQSQSPGLSRRCLSPSLSQSPSLHQCQRRVL